MNRIERCAAASALLLFAAAAVRAEEPAKSEDASRIEALEKRVGELEQAAAEHTNEASTAWLPEWTQRVRLGGSADVGYFHRGDLTPGESDAFQVWDARLFVDAELADHVELGGMTVIRNIGATAEWDWVRMGDLENDVGELYADFQGLGDSTWANAQVGRFQIPVGEAYLRYSKGYHDNPFISQPVGGPWFWDEGIKLYGADANNRFGYVASVSNGDTRFNVDTNHDPQGTLKLYTDPWPWLHVSVSGMVSGKIGHKNAPAPGALWLGETWAMPVGAFNPLPNYINGLPAPDGPNQIERTWFLGGDVIVRPLDGLRVWAGGGQFQIVAPGSGPYDRSLYYWIAEVVAEGQLVSPALRPLYLAARANGITTGDGGRGFLLDYDYAQTAGFNMRNLNEYSAALGVHIGKYVTLKGEYAFRDVDLVRGVSSVIHSQVGDEHWFGLDVGVAF